MSRLGRTLLASSLLATVTPAHAQQARTIDLANESPGGSVTLSVQPGDLTVLIENVIPGRRYRYSFLRENIPIETPKPDTQQQALAASCKNLESYPNKLNGAPTERDVRKLLEEARKIADDQGGGCHDAFEDIQARTRYALPDRQHLDPGMQLTVKISRLAATNSDGQSKVEAEYTVVFTTGHIGRWQVSYGYVFPVRVGLRENNFIAQPRDAYVEATEDGRYMIKTRKNVGVSAVPIIMFNFMPTAAETRSHKWGFVGGFGTDLKTPVIAAGYGVTYWQFLSVHVGLLAWQERDLLAQYQEGMIVDENLSTEQLTEEQFRVRPFFALTFHLGSNIFGGSDTTPPAPPPQAQSAGTGEAP